jgi:putative ABC transport system permease protein
MLRNYLAVALRHLAHNGVFFSINLIGLAVGIAAALLIALFVRDEFTYERFIPGFRHVYLVSTIVTPPEGHASLESLPTESDVASWLKLDIPAVTGSARLVPTQLEVRRGDFTAVETVYWADPDFFSLLHLPVYAGNLQTALARPDGLVLTQSMARKYFGRDDPIGETLEFARKERMTVTAVIKDLPSNTHLDVAAIASGRSEASSLTSLDDMPMRSFGEKPWGPYTYVSLKANMSAEDIERQLPALIDRHAPSGRGVRTSSVYHLHLLPITDIHLDAEAHGPMKPASRRETVYSVAMIGVLILLVATINFVNLMTSRASRRAVEVGIRKVAGARRRDLIVQFIGESLIYVGFASIAAASVAELLLPSVNAFLQRTMDFAYWSDPSFAAATLFFLVTLAMVASIYPALILSSLRPAQILSYGGIVSPEGSAGVRRSLVTAQVAVLIGLVLAAIVVYRQALFAMHQSLRVDSDQVLVIRRACSDGFKDAVKELRGVTAVACSTWAPPDSLEAASGASLPEGQAVLRYASVDFGFFELYGLKPLAGRFHAMNRGTDALPADVSPEMHESIVINEAAVHALGLATAQSAIGRTINWNHGLRRPIMMTGPHQSEIIGVVPDFLIGSIREPIQPAAFYVDPAHNAIVNVKLNGRAIPETLSSIDALWKAMGHSDPISRTFLDQLLQGKYNEFSRLASMLAILSAIAMLIACLGLFALSAFIAERRRKEIGIRKAFGAGRWGLVRLLQWEFAKPVLSANFIAWPLGFWLLDRWLHGFAYHVNLQPWIFILAGGLATAITLLTVFAHTLLVAGEKPVSALRYE